MEGDPLKRVEHQTQVTLPSNHFAQSDHGPQQCCSWRFFEAATGMQLFWAKWSQHLADSCINLHVVGVQVVRLPEDENNAHSRERVRDHGKRGVLHLQAHLGPSPRPR